MRFVLQLTVFGFRIAPLLLVVYWICIFTGTHLPGIPGPKPLFSDKVMHFLAFAGLAFIAGWALPGKRDKGGKRIGFAAFGMVCYAAFDELSQSLIPRRSTELADFVADCCGILVGLAMYVGIRKILLACLSKQAVFERNLRTSYRRDDTVEVG